MPRSEPTPQQDPPDESLIHRRSTLAGGLAGLAIAGLGSAAVSAMLRGGQATSPSGGTAAASPVGFSSVERVYSRARGRAVDLVTVLPARKVLAGLPVCALLHGLGGSARGTLGYGLGPRLFTESATRRSPPFAFVAVDGGDNYWREASAGDDPMAMLLEELPVWLRDRGLAGGDGLPFACAGVSMGAFGSLLYARRRAERHEPLAAVAALAPALITSWRLMRTREVFSSRRAWAAVDPLRHPKSLHDVRLGVWCGTEDPFIDGARKFIELTDPAVAHLGPGGHNDKFISGVAADVVRFVGAAAPVTVA